MSQQKKGQKKSENNGKYTAVRMLPLSPCRTMTRYHKNSIKEYTLKRLHIKLNNDIINDSININFVFNSHLDRLIYSWLIHLNIKNEWNIIFKHQNFLNNLQSNLERYEIILLIINELNCNIINGNYIEPEPRDDLDRKTNNLAVMEALKTMGILAYNPIPNKLEINYIYYKFIEYDSLKFLIMQDRKIKDRNKLMSYYHNKYFSIFGDNEYIWNIIMCFIAGNYAIEIDNTIQPYIPINKYNKRVNTWFNKKITLFSDNKCNVNNTSIDVQIHSVLKQLKLDRINNICSELDIEGQLNFGNPKNIPNNLRVLLKLLRKLNILYIDINEHLLLNNINWMDIIKANIMNYSCKYCFNEDNFS